MTNLVVRTQVKDILKESGLGLDNLAGDFMDKLDEKVKQLILDAAKRAKDNGRRTIMGKDV
jgi:histone H3/H4